jgi:hypothetical protein
MQNQYIGDVVDFGKYGLLRHLAGLFDDGPRLRLGVLWYLVPDGGRQNGARGVGYLKDSVALPYRRCDAALYDRLRAIVRAGRRSVDAIRTSGLLPPDTVFVDDMLRFGTLGDSKRAERRSQWMVANVQRTASCDLVFVDPDNGLECGKTAPTSRNGPRYAFLNELQAIVFRRQTLVLYQDTSRKRVPGREIQHGLEMIDELGRGVPPMALRFRGRSCAFFVYPAAEHHPLVTKRIASLLATPWSRYFELIVLRQQMRARA